MRLRDAPTRVEPAPWRIPLSRNSKIPADEERRSLAPVLTLLVLPLLVLTALARTARAQAPNAVEWAGYGKTVQYCANGDTLDEVDPHDFQEAVAVLAVLGYVLADMEETLGEK